MVRVLSDPTWLTRISLVILLLQPTTNIRQVAKVFIRWNPITSLLDMLAQTNDERIQNAEEYFKQMAKVNSSTTNESIDADGTLQMAIVIVTVKRSYGRYLLQTAARMREALLADDSCYKKMLFICNVDDDYEGHTDAIYLKQYMNYVDKSGKANFKLPHPPQIVHITGPQPQHPQRRKEIEDYIFCLNAGRSLNPKFVFMLEDDILPRADLFPVVRHVLDHTWPSDSDILTRDIDKLKLFSFDHLSSVWEYIVHVIRNYSLAVITGVTAVLINYACCIKHQQSTRYYFLTFARSMLVCSVFVLFMGNNFYFEILRFSNNFYTLEPMQRSSSAALIFRSDVLGELVEYLVHSNTGIGNEGHKDLAIDTFMKSSGRRSNLLRPYLLEHIGVQSSLTPL